MWQISELSFGNPAVNQWRLPDSYSEITAGFRSERLDRPVDPAAGSGEEYLLFEAATYIKYKTSTLWGSAAYHNGKQRDLRWNETSDLDLVYPYVLADSVGGDINLERYRFSGGYADRKGRWGWGATLGYEAGLYYRNVDPRPRNVTGKLDIAAGVTYSAGRGYVAGLSLDFRKYKQTCDIDFKNQTGVEKVYHATGLGTHYNRFAGTGLSTYYNGVAFGLGITLYPSYGSGIFAAARMNRFTFDNILSDLNKLPMASVSHSSLSAEAGYKHPGATHGWGVSGRFDISRRVGTENIFGDPASSIYPQTGQLDMYYHNFYSMTLRGLWQWQPKPGMLVWVMPEAAYIHDNATYLQPGRQMRINTTRAGATAICSAPLGQKALWRATVRVTAEFDIPSESMHRVDGTPTSPEGLCDREVTRFMYLTHRSHRIGGRVEVDRALRGTMVLRLSGGYRHSSYCAGNNGGTYGVSLSLSF